MPERLAEIRGHQTGRLTGYIPLTVLEEMGIRYTEGRTTWFTAEQSEAIKAHPLWIDGQGASDGD